MALKKISKNDFEEISDNPLENFRAGIKSEKTRERYERMLHSYLMDTLSEIIDGETFEDKIQTLVIKSKKEPTWAMQILTNILMRLRKRTELPLKHPDYYNPNSLRNDFKPFKKLFDMNDIPLVWKKIYSMYPEQINTNVLKTRAYTIEEIRTMLEHCKNMMEKAIILVHASSGIRPDGFDFTWEDVQPIFRIGKKIIINQTEDQSNAELVCATITIYKKSDSEIPAFITPEAYHSLMEWKKEYAHEIGHEPKDTDPVFKSYGFVPKQIATSGINSRIRKLLRRANLTKPHLEKGVKRADNPEEEREKERIYRLKPGVRKKQNKQARERYAKNLEKSRKKSSAWMKREELQDHIKLEHFGFW